MFLIDKRNVIALEYNKIVKQIEWVFPRKGTEIVLVFDIAHNNLFEILIPRKGTETVRCAYKQFPCQLPFEALIPRKGTETLPFHHSLHNQNV